MNSTTTSQRPVDVILSRLAGVRETGSDRWLGCCPAHEDRDPSLSIHETRDGTVLLYCFAGCEAADIVAAIELELADLFAADEHTEGRRRRPPGPRLRDVVEVLKHELWVVSIGASMAARNDLSTDECERITRAARRIREAIAHVR